MLLNEFNPNDAAVIEPQSIISRVPKMPKVVVSCFSYVTFERMLETCGGEKLAACVTANMAFHIYLSKYKGKSLALMMAPMGAAACVGSFEELFAMGVEKAVIFGTCGVLDGGISDCSVIIPTSALRDEGTSYHYAPASDEIAVNTAYQDKFISILNERNISYTTGKVWTTDAFYRETREKLERRKAAGCVAVDMECSALTALAAFRKKEIFQFFYAADNLAGEEWEARSLGNDVKLSDKDKVAELALEMALSIAP